MFPPAPAPLSCSSRAGPAGATWPATSPSTRTSGDQAEPLGMRRALGAAGPGPLDPRPTCPGPARRERAVGFSTKLDDIAEPEWFADYLRRRRRAGRAARPGERRQAHDVHHPARALKEETGHWNRAFRRASTSGRSLSTPTSSPPSSCATGPARRRSSTTRPSLDLPLLRLDYRDLLLDPRPRSPGCSSTSGVTPVPGHRLHAQGHERRPARLGRQLRRAARPLRRHGVRGDVRRGPPAT